MKVVCAILPALILTSFSICSAQPAPTPPSAPTAPPANWERTEISVGFSTYSGDQNSAQVTAQLNSTLQFGRLESDAIGNLGLSKVQGKNTTNQEELDWAFRFTRHKSDRWFSMIHTWYEHDISSGIDFRGAIGPGIGMHILDNATTRLTIEGGVCATAERQVRDQNYPVVFIDPSVRWNITKKTSLQQKLNLRFNMRDRNDVRMYTQGDLRFAVTKRVGVGLSLTIDYDNVPVAGHRKTDIQTSTNLTIGLGRLQ